MLISNFPLLGSLEIHYHGFPGHLNSIPSEQLHFKGSWNAISNHFYSQNSRFSLLTFFLLSLHLGIVRIIRIYERMDGKEGKWIPMSNITSNSRKYRLLRICTQPMLLLLHEKTLPSTFLQTFNDRVPSQERVVVPPLRNMGSQYDFWH